ncbi:VgrG-related protein [Saccharopolyspora rosea]|uniref:Phage baseplate assembly protein V n=1 Tax=Saccharopolyspora rosea TaxID=524884 RepID=A0ABW3FR70_9PSEU
MTGPCYAPRFEVRIAGLTMAADLAAQVLSVVVDSDLDLAGSFTLVLRNRDNAVLDSPLLDPGKTVEIHLGYGDDLAPAFLGEITSVEPSFPQDGPPTVRVSGYDKSYRMRHNQPEPTEYTIADDSLIAARLAVENGLVPVVDPTPALPEKVVQAESDMAFLKTRAQRYFFDVYVEWDRLHFQFPRPQPAAHVLEWGRNLSSFSPRISAAGLAGLQVVRGYNQELAQTVRAAVPTADLDPDVLVERLGSAAADLLGSLVREGLRTQAVDNPLDAALLARSLLEDLLDGLYEGDGSCIGLPDLAAGKYVEIRGVGKRFGGIYRLRKVTHRIDGGGFATDFSITQRCGSSLVGLLRKDMTEQPPPDRPERFYGVVVGEVQENRELVDTPPTVPIGRVKVSFPGLSDRFTSGWAPCARPMGGKGMGFYALPEPGEQVLVAFEHGDLARPYVLGSLWNDGQEPPSSNVDGENNLRLLRSRAGHTITFDDTLGTGALTIEDAAGSTITLDAQNGSITLSARTDLTIEADGTITLRASQVDVT